MNAKKLYTPRDPVCGRDVFGVYPTAIYEGKMYFFCSEACEKRFSTDPESFVRRKGVFRRFMDRLAEKNAENPPKCGCDCCH
ncbi:MAG: YHS domain-containing protein [Deltaproteobacteria bacterium]|nr:YHS domain-containing protein [Deltaproteobacteria bacterium]